MATLQRSRIVPAEKNVSGVVEKWALPDWSPSVSDVPQLFTTTARGGSRSSGDQSRGSGGRDTGNRGQQEGSREDGFAAGYAEGLQAAQQQVAGQTQEVAALLHALENPVRCVTEEVVSELLLLARDIANAILQKELQDDPAQLMTLVTEAVAAMPATLTSCEIAINPQDLELLKSLMSADIESEVVTKINWLEDKAIERGNFIIRQGDSRLHAGIGSMLKQAISQPETPAENS